MRKRRAYCCVKRWVEARFDKFMAGLGAAGYEAIPTEPTEPARRGDLLVLWNRMREHEPIADRFEREGGTVLVAENGYIGQHHWAISVHAHNGAGRWPSGSGERFAQLGIELRAWRAEGEHILICPNRQIGMRTFLAPNDWAERVAEKLRRLAPGRPLKVRPHPGNWKRRAEHPDVSLYREVRNAWACVIWSSSAGLRALIAGIPVIRCAPWWIGAGADNTDLASINAPATPERLPVFERIAWAQWTPEEVSSGWAFRMLVEGA